MTSAHDKHKLVFESVWEQNNSAIHPLVLRFWRDHGGPVDTAAQERLQQLAFVVKDQEGDVVGISTAYKVYIKQLRNYFYAIRLMLSPDYRIPGLTSKLLVSTRDFLESIHHREKENPAIGLITLVENARLKEGRNEAIWPASGMVYIGNSGDGHHIRVYYFRNARIEP